MPEEPSEIERSIETQRRRPGPGLLVIAALSIMVGIIMIVTRKRPATN
jgi:hypothetical protein